MPATQEPDAPTEMTAPPDVEPGQKLSQMVSILLRRFGVNLELNELAP
jgi:hypothetical protein